MTKISPQSRAAADMHALRSLRDCCNFRKLLLPQAALRRPKLWLHLQQLLLLLRRQTRWSLCIATANR